MNHNFTTNMDLSNKNIGPKNTANKHSHLETIFSAITVQAKPKNMVQNTKNTTTFAKNISTSNHSHSKPKSMGFSLKINVILVQSTIINNIITFASIIPAFIKPFSMEITLGTAFTTVTLGTSLASTTSQQQAQATSQQS